MTIPFWKMVAIGNDFPLIHVPLPSPGDLRDLAIAICDRRFGVGGDGLLALERTDPLRLRMFNPDGTEDFCGNGLRCAAVHARSLGWARDQFVIHHGDREVPVRIGVDGGVTTELGRATYDPAAVPLKAGTGEIFDGAVYSGAGHTIVGSALTTGSTHVVIPVAKLPEDEEFLCLGPKIENFDLYPARTSVIWCETVSVDHLAIRIWERGVGETLGCGTGSSAAAADYMRRQGRGAGVQVDNRGGTVIVHATAWNEPLSVTGTANEVYSGEFDWKKPS